MGVTIGPLLIFDKSFLQMLNGEEVMELCTLFHPVIAPPLTREILGDLKKEQSSTNRIPVDVVKSLARKMDFATGIQPADFRKVTIANLLGGEVPMFGQVPVDTTAPNVRTLKDGGAMLYDCVPDQRMWERWAIGDFSTEEQELATAWRRGLAKVDLRAIGDSWREFARDRFKSASNVSELVAQVDILLSDPEPETQIELLGFILDFVRTPTTIKRIAYNLLLERRYTRLCDFAPYAASVLKLYLVFIGGLARRFIGPRPSHYVDLQYLFYAPFCMVFTSADKLHRDLWPATAGINSFVWGPDLKADIANRIVVERNMPEAEITAHRQEYSFYPIEIEGSITNDLWKRYMRPRNEILKGARAARTIDDLEPEIQDLMRKAMRAFDEGRAQ